MPDLLTLINHILFFHAASIKMQTYVSTITIQQVKFVQFGNVMSHSLLLC